jgi:DNA-binding NtrC family response regulator
MKLLQSYPWPGNARQLANEAKRLVASSRGTTIGEEQLDPPTEQFETKDRKKELCFDRKTIDDVVNDIERCMIVDALKNIIEQTKSGSDTRPEPPGLIKKLKG